MQNDKETREKMLVGVFTMVDGHFFLTDFFFINVFQRANQVFPKV